MTTLTIKINEKSKKGKAFLAFAKTFLANEKDVEIIDSDGNDEVDNYNPAFVKMVLESAKSKNRTIVDPKNLWQSI